MLQVGGDVQDDVEASLSALFSRSTSDSKLGVQTSFLRRLCERQQLQEVQVHIPRLKEYGVALAHKFSGAKITGAKDAVNLLEALLCMCRMNVYKEKSDAFLLLQSLQSFSLFFQHPEDTAKNAIWFEKARVCCPILAHPLCAPHH
jgi:hypothetical protein